MVKSVNTNKVEKDKKAAIAVVFENPEFGKIRTLTDENGEPLFCAKDLCNILGYKRANDAVSQLVNDLDTAKRRNKVPGSLRKDGSRTVRTQLMLYVNCERRYSACWKLKTSGNCCNRFAGPRLLDFSVEKFALLMASPKNRILQ